MLTRDERYRLISFGEDDVAAAVYGQAERVFLESIGSTARTNSNEIAYWKDRYNEQFKANGDRLFIFGFQEDNELIGFALVFYFRRHSLVVVDHMAIKEPARHFGTFYTFKDMIADHLCALNLEIDYTIAEIVVSKLVDRSFVNYYELRGAFAVDPRALDLVRCISQELLSSNERSTTRQPAPSRLRGWTAWTLWEEARVSKSDSELLCSRLLAPTRPPEFASTA